MTTRLPRMDRTEPGRVRAQHLSEADLVARNGLAVRVDYTTWGGVHPIIGCVAIADRSTSDIHELSITVQQARAPIGDQAAGVKTSAAPEEGIVRAALEEARAERRGYIRRASAIAFNAFSAPDNTRALPTTGPSAISTPRTSSAVMPTSSAAVKLTR
jgi:hypothetical protein